MIKISVKSRPVIEVLNEIVQRCSPHGMNKVMKQIGDVPLDSTKQRFKTATDPEGNPWKPLADSTKRQKTEKKMKARGGRQYWKRDPGRMTKKSRTALEASTAAAERILKDSDALSESVGVQIVDGVLLVGVHCDFGNGIGPEVHQFGTRDGHVPAWPFLGLSKQDERTVLDILQRFNGQRAMTNVFMVTPNGRMSARYRR